MKEKHFADLHSRQPKPRGQMIAKIAPKGIFFSLQISRKMNSDNVKLYGRKVWNRQKVTDNSGIAQKKKTLLWAVFERKKIALKTCFWNSCYGNVEAQWPIGYGVGLRIKRSSVQIMPLPLHWVLGQGSLLPLSQGEAFTLASISYLAILVKINIYW